MFQRMRFCLSSACVSMVLLSGCSNDGVRPLTNVQASPLTIRGIAGWTNIERRQNGDLPALIPDTALDAIALARAKDMIRKQYFAHVGSDGNSAETVAKDQEYAYITIGENIALGDFLNDDDLVRQWMGSPDHRANILKTQYTHIGAAAVRGMYEKREQWFAVQIFAAPLSVCPVPDASLEKKIDIARQENDALERDAKEKSDALQDMPPSEKKNSLIRDYNELVLDIRSRQESMNTDITAYNALVEKRNECIGRHQ